MPRFFESPRFPGRRATNPDMFLLLGITGKRRWPDAGVPVRFIQGIWVHVLPVTHVSLRKQPGVKSSVHRVIASCPDCGKAVSAGRLHQHKCEAMKRRGKRTIDRVFQTAELKNLSAAASIRKGSQS